MNHEPIEPNIPEWLARISEALVAGMSAEKAHNWRLDFLAAIKPGADLERTKGPFLVMVLTSVLETFDHAKHPHVKAAIDESITVWRRDDTESVEFLEAACAVAKAAWQARVVAEAEWQALRAAAEQEDAAAAKAAIAAKAAGWPAEFEARWIAVRTAGVTGPEWQALREAARKKRVAERESVAAEAAWKAAKVAESAAPGTEASAAEAAAKAAAARAAMTDEAARAAAETTKYDYFADELLKLLAAAPMADAGEA